MILIQEGAPVVSSVHAPRKGGKEEISKIETELKVPVNPVLKDCSINDSGKTDEERRL